MERETLVEVGVSAASVGLFIAGLLVVGRRYQDGSMTSQGALELIALIVLFILLMTGIGYWLSAREP